MHFHEVRSDGSYIHTSDGKPCECSEGNKKIILTFKDIVLKNASYMLADLENMQKTGIYLRSRDGRTISITPYKDAKHFFGALFLAYACILGTSEILKESVSLASRSFQYLSSKLLRDL